MRELLSEAKHSGCHLPAVPRSLTRFKCNTFIRLPFRVCAKN